MPIQDQERWQRLAALGAKSQIPTPECEAMIEKDLIDCFVPKDGSAAAIGVAIEVMDLIAEQRVKLFPDLRKIILDYEADFRGGRLKLSVTSAPIPDLA